MAARVEFSPDAIADLESIGDYIAEHDPAAALRFLDRLRHRCRSLSEFPLRGRRYGERFRVVGEGDYLIFYRVEETRDGGVVVISIIIHGARDFEALLDER